MTFEQAHAEIERLRSLCATQAATISMLEERWAWSEGRRGRGAHRAPGFTVTETRVLRILAARGRIAYEQMDALQRHMSNIRKKLPPGVKIRTETMEGYAVERGLAVIQRLVAAAPEQGVRLVA